MLEIQELYVTIGNMNIIRGVSLQVHDGEVVSLMGSNGAGKTALMHALSGIGNISSGKILFNRENIVGWPSERIVQAGVIQVPEGRKLFPLMTVKENLIIGAYSQSAQLKAKENLEYVFSLFPELKEMLDQPAGNLSGGQQQMVSIGRGLMANPKLLILDEPSVGLSPIMTQKVLSVITEIKKRGVSVLIAEQNIFDVLQIADKAYVLEQGRIRASGTAKDILENKEIKTMYLGL